MYEKILIVDDSRSLTMMIKRRLENELSLAIDVAHSLAEAKQLLKDDNCSERYLMAILDVHLPDAPNGEVVDFVTDRDIPSVVLTGSFNENLRNDMYSRNIIDYLIKDGERDLDVIVRTVRRLRRNTESKVLVVDDSRFSRHFLTKLLQRQHYQILEAQDGQEAIEVINREPNVKLVVTDYNMPNMDGSELIVELRRRFDMDALGIIGVSASDENHLTAKMLKLGANDFLKKPFGVEEFYCRVNQNLELINLIREIKDASNTDHLTRLHNRRYFFETVPRTYDRSRRQNCPCAVAMVDIDYFKKVNDTYGHDAGDQALITTADLLRHNFRPTDIIARFGGEEFCVFMIDIQPEKALERMETLRTNIEAMTVTHGEHSFKLTASVGLTTDFSDNLEAMIRDADQRLYRAKKGGRNRVVHQD